MKMTMFLYFCLQVMLLALVAPASSLPGRRKNQKRSAEQQAMYEKFCLAGNLTPMEKMRNMCMCGNLRDAIPAQTELESIRSTQSTQGPASNEAFSSRSSGALQDAPIPCVDGRAKVDGSGHPSYPCSNVDLLSFVSLGELNGPHGHPDDMISDVWGWTDGVSEIAIVGSISGVSFVDVTVPSNPKVLGKIPGFDRMLANDIKTYKNFAYMISEGGNMQILNMTRLVEQKDSIPEGGIVINFGTTFGEWTNAHNLFINEETGFAYVVGTNLCNGGGLYMLDIRSLSAPVYAGCFGDVGYIHDVQCVIYQGADARYKGREICFASQGVYGRSNSLAIIDVTDKGSPTLLSRNEYAKSVYAHQGWLTEDHNYFIFGDEWDEWESRYKAKTRTMVFEVQDLKNVRVVGFHLSPTNAVDHNLFVVGKHIFQANYRAGLRILQIDDISAPKFSEVGYFDMYPEDNDTSFNAAWGVYPFFSSGIVIVTGIEQGLYILQPGELSASPDSTAMCDYVDLCTFEESIFQFFLTSDRRAYMYTMHGPGRNSPFGLGIFGLWEDCVERCVSETRVLDMKNEGWECGPCTS